AAGARYLDTGAMYRVATLHVLRQGIDPADGAAVARATADLPLVINEDPRSTAVLLDGEDISGEIRGPGVAEAAGARYLDTGAMYRVATLHVLRQGIDPADGAGVAPD
ncbi:(d)CMP kinase, partial [Corynebacterium bovis]|uniref:(d)CMP kinase n=1 Tax=Corynebacterium bovis TaxID=36808 RepID=UPI003138C6CF